MGYLVSIIIPIYNAEKYIENCVKDIEEQTYDNIEIILVDDGSTDHSGKLCDRLQECSQNVRVIHQKNEGVSSARNRGTQIANGEYLMYMDVDDVVVHNAISCALKYALRYNADIVIGHEEMIMPAQKTTFRNIPSKGRHIVFNKEQFDELRKEYLGFNSQTIKELNGIGNISGRPCSRIIRTSIAKDVVFPLGIQLGEDKLWNLRILNKSKCVCIVNDRWYGYVIYENSAVRRFYGNRIDIGKKFLETLYTENQEFCDENPDIFAFNIAVQLYCVAFYELLSKECTMSIREKKDYIKTKIDDSPWKFLWIAKYKSKLPTIHKLMLPLYKSGLWFEVLKFYKTIKRNRNTVSKI